MQDDPAGQTQRWEFTELLGLDSLEPLPGSIPSQNYNIIDWIIDVENLVQKHVRLKNHG